MNLSSGIKVQSLLTKDDPNPVEIVNGHSDHPLLLVCEHAGRCIPSKLDGLGISGTALDSHIGWDIGAEAVTRSMAQALGSPAVIQRYSRLVIDCNRPHDAADAIPQVSDCVEIPKNFDLSLTEQRARIDEIFTPFHNEVTGLFEKTPRQIVLSIHSFTSSMDGNNRPWKIGFLFRKDTQTSAHLGRFINEANPELTIGMNEPYQIDDVSDWFVPHHGEARSIPHSLIEIRNDQIRTAEGQAQWAGILVNAVNRYLKEI